jgi:hypothetical protein
MLLVVAGTLEHECEEGVGKILGCILLRELDEETMAHITYCLDADVLAKIVDALSPSITNGSGPPPPVRCLPSPPSRPLYPCCSPSRHSRHRSPRPTSTPSSSMS